MQELIDVNSSMIKADPGKTELKIVETTVIDLVSIEERVLAITTTSYFNPPTLVSKM